jgi:hypothetical protein
MVKFLAKKGLLSLVPFQAASPEDADYIWPEAYTGDIENLIGILRQCPSYQIDKNHTHCGLRTKLLPALDYIKNCIDAGVGVRLQAFKTEDPNEAWIPKVQLRKKAFVVGGEDVAASKKGFDFVKARNGDMDGMIGEGKKAKALFTAVEWSWIAEPQDGHIFSTRPTYRAVP